MPCLGVENSRFTTAEEGGWWGGLGGCSSTTNVSSHRCLLLANAILGRTVRRAEVNRLPELKGTRYVWTKNQPNLTGKQSAVLDALSPTNLKTARAQLAGIWRMRLAFQDIYQVRSRKWGALFFDKWLGWAKRSRLEPMKTVARTMDQHRDGILAWLDGRGSGGAAPDIANGLIEGINSLVQATKAKARCYRNIKTLKAVTDLVAGKLDIKLPT
jgi:transposase